MKLWSLNSENNTLANSFTKRSKISFSNYVKNKFLPCVIQITQKCVPSSYTKKSNSEIYNSIPNKEILNFKVISNFNSSKSKLNLLKNPNFQCSGTVCKKSCASDELDCYILDNNGFIIISERHEHTGKFFGEIDGTIMDSLVQDKIFKKVTVVDYQGVCSPQMSQLSSAAKISDSIIKFLASTGNFFWTLVFDIYLRGSWETVVAYGNDPDNEGKSRFANKTSKFWCLIKINFRNVIKTWCNNIILGKLICIVFTNAYKTSSWRKYNVWTKFLWIKLSHPDIHIYLM